MAVGGRGSSGGGASDIPAAAMNTGSVTTTIGTTSTNSTVQITLKLSQLQNLCKRDPAGYKDEYDAQIRRLESELNILLLQPDLVTTSNTGGNNNNKFNSSSGSSSTNNLTELIQFAAAVSSSSYKGAESDKVANMLMNLLVGGGSTYVSHCPENTTGMKKKMKARNDTTVPHHVLITTSISSSAYSLHRDVRKSIVSALILMRNKGVIEPLILLQLFFRIMSVIPDKTLREILYKHIVNDIRNINKKGKRDEILNRNIQAFLHRIVSSTRYDSRQGSNRGVDGGSSAVASGTGGSGDENNATDIAAKRSVDMVCELYRRRVWTDDRTVAILATAIESYNATIMCRALRFFLNIEEKMLSDDAQKQIEAEADVVVDLHLYSKKTAARQRQTERQLKAKKKAQERKERLAKGEDWVDDANPENDVGVEASKKLYPAIELLRNPQGVAEVAFHRLRTGNTIKYEQKLLLINFITRLVGNHELMVLPLYPYLQKYMSSHQRDVTAVLAYTVQACHEYVPPDEIYGLLKTIATNFISERCSEEQMAVGINTVRAICSRVPTVLNIEESKRTLDGSYTTSEAATASASGAAAVVMDIEAFVRDIAEYSKHKDRSVTIAARSWINYVRSVHPILLQGKDRGLYGTALAKSNTDKTSSGPQRYGEMKVAQGVEGADLLVEYEAKKQLKNERKRLAKQKKNTQDKEHDSEDEEEEDDDADNDDGEKWTTMSCDGGEDKEGENNDDSDGWEETDDENDPTEEMSEEEEEEDGDDEEAPQLVLVDGNEEDSGNAIAKTNPALDVSKLSQAERDKIKLQVSSTRIFTTEEFIKMRKLVEREKKLLRDPRARARQKRALARGDDVNELSDDDDDDNSKSSSDSDSSDDDSDDAKINIKGAVNVSEIMATAAKKRQNKAERLERVLAGRSAFETKQRGAGSTNVEKQRRKNFLMSKLSKLTKSKGRGKPSLQRKRKDLPMKGTREQQKRRRRM